MADIIDYEAMAAYIRKLEKVVEAARNPYLAPSDMPDSEEYDAYARLQAALDALEAE